MTRDEALIRAALEMAAETLCDDLCDDPVGAIRAIDPAEVLAKVPPAWQPIETAPRDGTLHVRGLTVKSHRTGARWFEAIAGRIDHDGDFIDHDDNSPWHADDYECWTPLPTPPQETPND